MQILADDEPVLFSNRWSRRTIANVSLSIIFCLGVVSLGVLYFSTSNDVHVLMQRKSPVRYYWIPRASARLLHVHPGQVLEEDAGESGSNETEESSNAKNATNATNATVELPPFGESLEDPPPECDLAQMSDGLGALESQIASLQSTTESDSETADFFCRNMKEPFQCACKACKLDQLGQWDYMYYHSNITDRAKQLLAEMRVEAQCRKLRNIGAEYFPAGHGCNMLYQTVCTDPQMV